MKKVLLGLLLVSVISIADQPDLGADPVAGTNIFQTGQEGAIVVKGKLTSDMPIVKYVIYASSDNGATKEDILTLEDFLLTTKDNEGGFIEENPKVYVKRLIGTSYGELNETDKVEFSFLGDPAYQNFWLEDGKEQYVSSVSLLSKSTLEEIIRNSGVEGLTVSSSGFITDGSKIFMPNNMSFITTKNDKGVLGFYSKFVTNTAESLNQADTNRLLIAFASGKEATTAKVLVRIK